MASATDADGFFDYIIPLIDDVLRSYRYFGFHPRDGRLDDLRSSAQETVVRSIYQIVSAENPLTYSCVVIHTGFISELKRIRLRSRELATDLGGEPWKHPSGREVDPSFMAAIREDEVVRIAMDAPDMEIPPPHPSTLDPAPKGMLWDYQMEQVESALLAEPWRRNGDLASELTGLLGVRITKDRINDLRAKHGIPNARRGLPAGELIPSSSPSSSPLSVWSKSTMPSEHRVAASPLYAVLLNPGSSRPKRYAATVPGPGAATTDVGKARKFSTVPDATIWVEAHREKFPRAEPMIVPVDAKSMEAGQPSQPQVEVVPFNSEVPGARTGMPVQANGQAGDSGMVGRGGNPKARKGRTL